MGRFFARLATASSSKMGIRLLSSADEGRKTVAQAKRVNSAIHHGELYSQLGALFVVWVRRHGVGSSRK
jgi:HJR/Mrr/RecB family endonuclease